MNSYPITKNIGSSRNKAKVRFPKFSKPKARAANSWPLNVFATISITPIRSMNSRRFKHSNGYPAIRTLFAYRKLYCTLLKSDEITGRLALVFDLFDMNLYEMIKGRKTYLPEKKVKLYMFQLFKALDYTHRSGVFHRDIKPSPINQ